MKDLSKRGYTWGIHNFMTGFAKRDLPHTSKSMNLKDCNLSLKEHTNLKLSPCFNQCWYSLLSKLQGSSCFQSEVMNRQSW